MRSKYTLSALTRRMPMSGLKSESHSAAVNDDDSSAAIGGSVTTELRKCLTARDVIAFGVGSTLGAGLWVSTGPGAHSAGPAIVLSFVIASFACLMSAFAYAEFAARCPVSGSAYSFTYVGLGELMAWFVGWNLTLEYAISAAAVARGWSSNLVLFFENVGGHPPDWLNELKVTDSWSVSPLSAAICLVCMAVLLVGVQESARFNLIVTALNLMVIVFIIILGSVHIDASNWTRAARPDEVHMVPAGCDPAGGFFPCGVNGLVTGAAKVFFSYVGFDAVTTLAEEVKNPKRDMPLGIMGTLLITTSLYVGVTIVVTGMMPWFALSVKTPIATAFNQIGLGWAATVIAAITVTGLTSTTLCSLFGQPRIFLRMSRDGLLLEAFGRLNPKTQVPVVGTLVTGIGAALIAFSLSLDSLSEMISIGTLLAFSTVCAGVIILRYQSPERPRQPIWLVLWLVLGCFGLCAALRNYADVPWPAFAALGVFTVVPVIWLATLPMASVPETFQCPLVPFLPAIGIFANAYLICSLDWESYVRVLAWTVLGGLNYALYGIIHSKLGAQDAAGDSLNEPLMSSVA
jgi:amino acid transporter